jgi:DNA primase
MADRVDASVPFVRFRVERELAAADLSSAEGKDAVIVALRPVFAQLPASAMREELVGLVADRTGLAPALVASWLAQGAAPSQAQGPSGGNGAPQRRPALSQPALDAAGRAERNFLAQCQASGSGGLDALRAMDLEAAFATERMRRAAEHIRARLAGENVHVPDDDEDDVATLVAEIGVLAGQISASESALEAERLKLERVALDGEIAAVRAAGQPTHELSRARHDLTRRIGEAEGRALEETHTRE